MAFLLTGLAPTVQRIVDDPTELKHFMVIRVVLGQAQRHGI